MIKAVLNVEGMSCSHCENAIKKAVGALDGVGSVAVDLNHNTVTVEYESSNATLERIKNEIEDQGYDVH
jgi:copper chaperone